MTGPKSSSWIISSSCPRPTTTEGAKQKPREPTGVPPVTTSAASGPALEVAAQSVQLGGAVERAEVGISTSVPPTFWLFGPLAEGGDELVVDRRTRQHSGRRGAVLAGVEGARHGDPPGAASTFASSKTTTGAFPPSSRWTRLTPAAASAATSMPARTLPVTDTIAGVGCSTSKRPVSRSPQTTLSTPARQMLGHDLGHQHGRGGGGVGRLEHHRVAGSERGCPFPDRHHQRVVPRRDRRADADRLPTHVGGVVLQVLAGRQAFRDCGPRRRRTGSGRRAGAVPRTW